ncbi:hypothetical protein NA57DRAFT_53921 [Rhizodiscina lignyota]|uniref:C3H1-type domain-containing protein n=1 Tax=Rhizodiscina lignyota TaxID=1504668 RepID=A0A9P4M9C8_9PEZI|nr:hypothetical protein NA57DRAFT_53921 [Rhizodiscina lignyota]
MNGGYAPPPFAPPPPPPSNGHRPALGHRLSNDFTATNAMPQSGNNNGPIPVSVPSQMRGGMAGPPGMNTRGQGVGGYAGSTARSPPSAKNTSHVPCKFFRKGECQAGHSCPFSHSLEPALQPCKYFQKGNCKFGMKCANDHILADGRRANRPGFGLPPNAPLHPRWQQGAEPPHPTSLLTMEQQYMNNQPQSQAGMQQMPDDSYRSAPQPMNIPTIDTTFTSHPRSNYGSPPNETSNRLGMSPVQRGLSVLDAPLPASFDSQGVSNGWRYGPIATSFPSRFPPYDSSSPPSSLPRNQVPESSMLRKLHNTAYADEARLVANSQNGFLGSSPPAPAEDNIGRRIMHSERFSSARPKLGVGNTGTISSSLPGRPIDVPRRRHGEDEWDENFQFEDQFVPKALHDDILTPEEQEKSARRLSSGRLGGDLEFGDGGSLSHRHSLSALAAAGSHGSPADSTSNSLVGSPNTNSRFGALFSRSRIENAHDGLPGASAFGHVGSPLRNSSLQIPGPISATPGEQKRPRPTSIGSSLSVESYGRSPPGQTGVGMISQQLQRTRLSSRNSDSASDSSAAQRPSITSNPSNSSNPLVSSNLRSAAGQPERVPSGGVGTGRDRIEEEFEGEEQEGLFDMEELGPASIRRDFEERESQNEGRKERKSGLKRLSGGAGWGLGFGNRSSAKVGMGELGENGLGRV